jgi:hypothetical protein
MKTRPVVIMPAVEKLAVPWLGVPADMLEAHTQLKLDALREQWIKFKQENPPKSVP